MLCMERKSSYLFFSLFEIRWRIVFGRSGRKLRDVGTARPRWFRIQCHNEGGVAFHLQSPRLKRIELVIPSVRVVGDERQSE